MELTQEQIQKLQQTLITAKACPNCGCTDDKVVDPSCYELLSLDTKGGSINLGGSMTYQPLITVRCPRCSFTSFFNLKTMGNYKLANDRT